MPGSSRLSPLSWASVAPKSACELSQNWEKFPLRDARPLPYEKVLSMIRYSAVSPWVTISGGLPRLTTCAQTVLYGGRITA